MKIAAYRRPQYGELVSNNTHGSISSDSLFFGRINIDEKKLPFLDMLSPWCSIYMHVIPEQGNCLWYWRWRMLRECSLGTQIQIHAWGVLWFCRAWLDLSGVMIGDLSVRRHGHDM